MKGLILPGLLCAAILTAQEAPIPTANGLSGRPFAIKNKWVIGGSGSWDYLTLDASAGQLFIAHGTAVQVVDVSAGTVAETVNGFREAHAIALDDAGEFAYVTDGLADLVRVFDRRSYRTVATIHTGPSPRALAVDAATGFLFVICSGNTSSSEVETQRNQRRGPGPHPPQPKRTPSTPSGSRSTITVIDTQKKEALADIVVSGRLGYAQSDGSGKLYITVEDRDRIAELDTQAVAGAVQSRTRQGQDNRAAGAASVATTRLTLDWSGRQQAVPASVRPRMIPIGQECSEPRGVAVDSSDGRLFVACNNQKMAVVNAATGEQVAAYTIGPGVQSIAFDQARGLIFTANGGGYGSVTVIRRDVTDTYSVVQNLPTLQQARTMAVNPSSGEVYVVTTLFGANLANPPMNGIGTLKINPVDGSFQVLVIGN